MHTTANGTGIAWLSDGVPALEHGPAGLLWLGGFMSDMTGSKAVALARLAGEIDRNCIRFDYSGHGASDGKFEDGTISRWLGEAVDVFAHVAAGPRVIVGSSMGGWLSLLLWRRLSQDPELAARVRGMVLIAPAADMTAELLWARYDDHIRERITSQGFFAQPSDYSDEPYIITRALIEDGAQHSVLSGPTSVPFPVRILQGEDDPDVPWQHAMRLFKVLEGSDVSMTLIKSGDHRLSTPRDIETLRRTCVDLLDRADHPVSR